MFEFIFDAVLAAVLLFFLILGWQIPEMSSPGDFVEAKGFPVIFSLVALCLLACEVYAQVRQRKKARAGGEAAAPGAFDMKQAYKVLIILAMTVVYILTVQTVGFVILSVAFTFIALNLLESKNQGFNLVFAVLAVLVLTLIFGRFFGVSLPRGAGVLKTLSFYLY